MFNDLGVIVQEAWLSLSNRFSNVKLDQFVIMPNHVHGLIFIRTGAACRAPTSNACTLGNIVRAFKSISSIKINKMLSRTGQAFWQRNYYEHIIRNEKELRNVRQYILDNPLRWEFDRENPNGHLTKSDEIFFS